MAVREAQVDLRPVSLAITIGLMFGPVADLLENAAWHAEARVSAGLVGTAVPAGYP